MIKNPNNILLTEVNERVKRAVGNKSGIYTNLREKTIIFAIS